FFTPSCRASAGYYYQHRDQEEVNGSGVRGRLAYEMASGVTAGVNISNDKAFDTRVSADLKVRFGGAAVQQLPVINALKSTPSNRDVRVHDDLCSISIPPRRDVNGNILYDLTSTCGCTCTDFTCAVCTPGYTPWESGCDVNPTDPGCGM
ncbi:hypothetical protein N8561_01815, partial [bacterium]|nr:hypothetical protein [bacterium]